MHLAGFMLASQVVHSHAIWRHPQTELGWLTPDYYQNIARTEYTGLTLRDHLRLPAVEFRVNFIYTRC